MEHLYTYENPVSQRDIARVVASLQNDGIISYPTDLNWAFGCDASNVKAIDRIKRLKPGKELPFSLICKDISMISQYANVDNFAYPILKKIFPGPYTVLLARNKTLPRQLHDKRRLVGMRIPKRPLVLALVDALANRYLQPRFHMGTMVCHCILATRLQIATATVGSYLRFKRGT